MRALRPLAVLFFLIAAPVVANDDRDTLATMLDAFLAGASVGDPSVHERFWADDLVYTSSAGARTNKAAILESVRGAADAQPDAPAIVYTAEDVDIRLYSDMAIVAFRLVATPSDGTEVLYYFNTGTFVARDGEWRAVAWQATKIPSP